MAYSSPLTHYRDRFDLQGKTAVVTGGLGIIGRPCCAGLAEAGAAVAVVDLDGPATAAFAEELSRQYGPAAIGISCDVSNPESVSAMADSVIQQLGGIDILHNNAAWKSEDLVAFFAPFEEYSLEQWRRIMAVNIDGMFLVAQAVGRHMISRKQGGSIVQTASIYGLVAPDQRIYEGSQYMGRPINTPAVYASSKGAVIALSRYLATYWAEMGIRVNTLVPGGVASGQNNTFTANYSARVPMGRMAKPDEIVATLLYLASDASSYVTGQILVVDGGLSAW